MKFGPRVLLEIVRVLQEGLLQQKDISQELREIEVEVSPDNPDIVELASLVNLQKKGY